MPSGIYNDKKVKAEILNLFYTLHDNRDRNIAEILGLHQGNVSNIIDKHLKEKEMTRLAKQIEVECQELKP